MAEKTPIDGRKKNKGKIIVNVKISGQYAATIQTNIDLGTDTVGLIKNMLEGKFGHPAKDWLLQYQGYQLTDDSALLSTVHIVSLFSLSLAYSFRRLMIISHLQLFSSILPFFYLFFALSN